MSNRKAIIIFSTIVIILIIIAIICITSSKKEDLNKLSQMYQKIKDNQNFTFTMEAEEDEFKYKVAMLQRGTDVCIDMYTEEDHNTTLVLETGAYYIMHDEQEYYDFGDEDVESDIIISGLEKMTQQECKTGKDTIEGKSYYYEEYNNDGDKFIIFLNVSEKATLKTRFYFDNNELKYIKNIMTIDDETHEEIIKANIKYEVDEKLFEIPKNYAEADME